MWGGFLHTTFCEGPVPIITLERSTSKENFDSYKGIKDVVVNVWKWTESSSKITIEYYW